MDFQKEFAASPSASGVVMDGRDIGTVICPTPPSNSSSPPVLGNAQAAAFKELQGKGIETTYDAVLADMKERDARNSGRERPPQISLETPTS